MLERERRSCASAPLPRRKRWVRPDAPRPVAARRPAPLPSADPIVPMLVPTPRLTRAEVTALLSAPARMDLRAGSLAGFGGVAS